MEKTYTAPIARYTKRIPKSGHRFSDKMRDKKKNKKHSRQTQKRGLKMDTGSINSGYYAATRALASGSNEALSVYAAKSAMKMQEAQMQVVSDALEQSKKIGQGRRELRV